MTDTQTERGLSADDPIEIFVVPNAELYAEGYCLAGIPLAGTYVPEEVANEWETAGLADVASPDTEVI